MYRIYIVFCVIFINYCNAFIEQLVYNNNIPKCCYENEALTLVGRDRIIPYQCLVDVNRTSHILVKGTLEHFPWSLSKGVSCIDNFIGDNPDDRRVATVDAETYEISYLSFKYFAKCCPVGNLYDAVEHRCVQIINESEDNSTLIEEVISPHLNGKLIYLAIGLSKCKFVISDYEITSFNDILYQTDESIVLEQYNKIFQYGTYCIDKVFNSENYVVRGCEDYSVCKTKIEEEDKPRCIKKCCPDGYYYKGGSRCKFGFTTGLNFYNDSKIVDPEEPFAIVEGHSCRHYIVPLDWNYTVNEMGFLILDIEENDEAISPFETSYCFEEVDMVAIQGRRLFLCFEHDNNNSFKYQVSRICLVLSSFFLILTLLAYICVPEMQNLPGNTLMSNCGSLLVAFTILAFLQFYPGIEGPECKYIGYLVMYTFLAAFMWSHVMSFDIFMTFGSMRIDIINQRRNERRRFLYYCLYAWTTPLIITVTAFLVQHFKQSLPDGMAPFIPTLGDFSCFFEEASNLPAFLTWFMLPIVIVCVTNLYFFLKTIIYCYKVKAEIAKMKDSHISKSECKKNLSDDTERLWMVVKLFLIMGIPWLFESISAALIPPNTEGAAGIVEIVFDTVNSLQGVFIFCVFILKRNFLKLLRNRLLGTKLAQRGTRTDFSGATTTSYVNVPSPKVPNSK